MDESSDRQPEKMALEPADVYWGRVEEKKLDEDLKGLEAETRGAVDEPKSGPWDTLKSSEDDKPMFNIQKWTGLLFALLVAVLYFPFLRWLGIIAGVIAGLYFGVKWLWKGILRQEIRPFSRESGFYWLLLSVGAAFGLFLFDLLVSK